ncbi:MAG TPA: hypothetical protein VKF81_12415 [Blastocatellia bacterium]|nr:hypothetical protein [Blastocatellia bacterium]
MAFKYRQTVLSELSRHGVIPNDDTPPELIHGYVNDLYRHEIRALKEQMRAGCFPKHDYAARVEQLRKRYPVLSLPIQHWTENE